jgi:diguanylate cyclase (GGDEF)-like protein
MSGATRSMARAAAGRALGRDRPWRMVASCLAAALLPSLLWFAAGHWLARHQAEATARAVAWAAQQMGAATSPAGMTEMLNAVGAGPDQWRQLRAPSGQPLASSGDPALASALAVEVARPIVSARGATTVLVRQGLDGLVKSTIAVALLGGLAGAVAAMALQRRRGTRAPAADDVRRLLVHDPLTGLLNREGLRLRLERALHSYSGRSKTVGLLILDLDRFRVINETLGQPAGDRLLQAVAERLRAILRPGVVAARLGADQFALQAGSVGSVQAMAMMARNAIRALEPVFPIDGQDCVVTVSVGIALADVHAGSVDQLIKNAEAATRAAKAGGGGRVAMFEPSMLADTRRQLELDMRLRRALQVGEFELLFQPIIGTRGDLHAVEALLRWNDRDRGQVSPGEFIPVLEQTGLIVAVGDWVLREACRRGRSWVRDGAEGLVLSVNVSPLQFAEADFVHRVQAALLAADFPPELLQLEVTEGLLLDPTEESLAKIDALADLGVRLAVDDFGMGYSSLAYLKRFRLHALKIDRMFAESVTEHARDGAIVRAIVELGHALELHVTAEGVETVQQKDRLSELGCDSLQGYLFARPMSEASMRALIREHFGHVPPAPREDWSTTLAPLVEPEFEFERFAPSDFPRRDQA